MYEGGESLEGVEGVEESGVVDASIGTNTLGGMARAEGSGGSCCSW